VTNILDADDSGCIEGRHERMPHFPTTQEGLSMKHRRISQQLASFAAVALIGAAEPAASAEQWMARVGAQSPDLGSQAQAFLPNEMWIHAGDGIRWTLASTEIHTVTFLTATQLRPPTFGMVFGIGVGCPGNTPDGAAFDGSSCVNSGLLGQGPITVGPGLQTYSVTFPSPGNFKLSCLVHFYMQGTIHVLAASAPLPHDQAFYDSQASKEGVSMVATTSGLRGLDNSDAGEAGNDSQPATVTAGVGAIVTTSGAGGQQLSLVRFLQPVIVVRVGDTVEWTNHDTNEPHTVTFGTEPTDPRPPSTNVSPTLDGARQATISSTTDSVNSGLLALAPQDRTGLPETPLGVTRFRVTFTAPGTYKYICSLHDILGMGGTVIVH
jgi:plastocyanin